MKLLLAIIYIMNLFGEAEKIMKNKYFLYFVVVLAGSNLLGYINTSEWNAAIFFVAISGVIFYYTNNVPLALIIAVFATSFFMAIVYKRAINDKSFTGKHL
jgi:hypothetical protein